MDNFGPVILIEVKLMFGRVSLFACGNYETCEKSEKKNQKKKGQET